MAARFWIGGGTNTNWNASPTTNWSATSGGTIRVAAPTVSDDVTFDGVGTNANTASIVSASNSCLSLTFTSGFTNTITINTAVVLTIAGNFTDHTNHTWVVSGTGSLSITASSSITSGGKTFPGPVAFSGASATKTLVGDWTISGVLTINTNVQIINRTASENLTCGGWIVNVGTTGTINIVVTGGSINSGSTVGIASLTFGGTIAFGTYQHNAGSLIYSGSGTVTVSGTLTLNTCTLNTNGVTWNNVGFVAGSTITINSLLTATTFSIGAISGVTFAGTSGWTCSTFSDVQTAAQTMTLKNGVTYTITNTFTCSSSRTGTPVVFTSDDATLKAILILFNGSSCNINANLTRIDASAGRPILSFNGVITSCINVFAYTDVQVQPFNNARKLGRRKPIYNRAKTVQYL